MVKILIKNGRIWDGDRFCFADILTCGKKIVKIGPQVCGDATYVYDAAGKTVSAGLVDLHVHTRIRPTDTLGIQPEMGCFPFGVTAAAEAGRTYCEQVLLDSMMLKNVVFAAANIHNNQPDLTNLEKAVAGFGHRAAGVKVYFDTTVSEMSDVTPLAQICAFAKERGLPVMVHCSHSPVPMPEILSTLNEGDILTHAFHGGVHNAAEDGFTSMQAAQKRGVVIDTGFAGNVHTDFSVFRKAIEAGVLPDTISTDITQYSAYMRGGRYGMTMCMNMAKHLGMGETDIFRAVTQTPARVLGKADAWGCLTEGGTADIAVFADTDEGFSITDHAGHHIESKSGYRCVLTVADGQIVYIH